MTWTDNSEIKIKHQNNISHKSGDTKRYIIFYIIEGKLVILLYTA